VGNHDEYSFFKDILAQIVVDPDRIINYYLINRDEILNALEGDAA
jgi:hypothetical protein